MFDNFTAKPREDRPQAKTGASVVEILRYLKGHGERLDSEIAKATGISLEKVRHSVSELAAAGEIIMCRSTRFEDGKPNEGWLCRVSGYIPPASPGRKPKAAG